MDHLVGLLVLVTLGIVVLTVGFFYLRSLKAGRGMEATAVRRARGSAVTTYPRRPVRQPTAPIASSLLVAIIASAMFAGGFVGLLMISHYHG